MRAATGRRRDWPRRYPPLTAVIIALALAVFALPSALNLPQANPSQTLEYAPVPGDQGNTSSGGNFAGLGLGSGGGADPAGLPPPPPAQDNAPLSAELPNQGGRPSTKQCVGNPPRQTEDPTSPPCVAFFQGDNGGATYNGVSRSEVKILFYSDSGFTFNGCNQNPPPPDRYYDLLAQPPDPNETCEGTILRTWQRYFNARYQTYGRTVHFFLYFGRGAYGSATAEQRRADAEENVARQHPFAVVPMSNWLSGNLDAYESSILKTGVLLFTSVQFEPAASYSTFAPLKWGYLASSEEQAGNFASYVCSKVKDNNTSMAGPVLNNKKRVYGLVTTSDPSATLVRGFEDYTVKLLQRCGISFKDGVQYTHDGGAGTDANFEPTAEAKMATFQNEGITTIIWPGGYETQLSHAAAKVGYQPEWLLAGDGVNDSFGGGLYQDSTTWNKHVLTITPVARMDTYDTPHACFEAWSDADNNPSDFMSFGFYVCTVYPSIRQLFTGIQVAGPRLKPASVDQGFHAIPPYLSHDPHEPACYYDPGDFSCLKDAQAEWWDQTGTTNSNPGCYRMIEQGARYTSGRWPPGDISAQRRPSDPCNEWGGGVAISFYASPPGG